MYSFRGCFWACLASLACCHSMVQAEIEAVQGKQYTLSKQHGPWMIMVASIRDVDEDRRLKEGMSAKDAASQLVYELRRKGIPAYTYVRDTKMGELTAGGIAQRESRQYVAEHGYISVLAGNFTSSTDEDLEKVLKYIKHKFSPKFLMDSKNGGLFAITPGRPGPLSKAFVTVNPLLTPEEVKKRTVDRETEELVRRLNADSQHSLLDNKGKYTLVIATFSGKSVMQVGGRIDPGSLKQFENRFGSFLDQSGEDAWVLTEALRSGRELGYEQDYEAWVYHDRNKSYVTVGSFDDPNDPRVRTLATQFGAKPGRDPKTGEEKMDAEVFSIPRHPKPGRLPDRMWVFEPKPRLMEVPRPGQKK